MKKIYWHYPHLKFWMGGTRYIFDVLSRLKGYEKIIICNGGKENIIDDFKKAGIRVKSIIPINTNSLLYWLFFPCFFIVESFKSFYYLKNADLIVATLFPSNLICALFSKIYKKKYVYLCYEPFPFFHNKDYIHKQEIIRRVLITMLSFLYSNLDIWATKNASRVVTIDEYKKKEILKIYGIVARNISVGVDTDFFVKKNSAKLTKKYEGKKIVLHSTDYTALKRTDLVLKAWKIVSRVEKNALLLITSTQPNSSEKEKYMKQASQLGILDKVKFIGLVKYADLPIYYSMSNCYVSGCTDPVVATNLPVKEALACETPAIRSSIAMPDVINGVSGYVVDPRNASKFASRIILLLKNRKIKDKFGKVGRKTILKRYSWVNVIKGFNSIITKI